MTKHFILGELEGTKHATHLEEHLVRKVLKDTMKAVKINEVVSDASTTVTSLLGKQHQAEYSPNNNRRNHLKSHIMAVCTTCTVS